MRTASNHKPFRHLRVLLYKVLATDFVRPVLKSSGNVTFILPKVCVKSSPTTSFTEARTMAFVRQTTSIPVPKVHAVFKRKGRVYIVMERISGDDIGKNWNRRSEESKRKLLCQLKAFVEELRTLAPPPDVGVAGLDQSPICDQRLPGSSNCGPFRSVQDFHQYLRNGVDAAAAAHLPDVQDLISFHDGSLQQSVFTHGDLSSTNILARGDTITGIIDWETAGWLPDYWEYTSAWHVNPQNQFWQDEVDKFLVPHPRALQADAIRRKYFGDV